MNRAIPGKSQIQTGTPQGVGRVDPQRNQAFQRFQRIAEDIAHALRCAEQVADHGKRQPFTLAK